MIDSAMQWVVAQAHHAEATYHVNPVIFLILYLGTWAPYAIGLVKTGLALKNKDMRGLRTWGTMTAIVFVLPYAYILGWGRGFPWWLRPLVVVILIAGGYLKGRQIMKHKGDGG